MIDKKAYGRLIEFAMTKPEVREIYVGLRNGRDVAYFHIGEISDSWFNQELAKLREEIKQKGLADSGVFFEAVHFSLDALVKSPRFKGERIWNRESASK